MSEQEVKIFEKCIVNGTNKAFQRLVDEKKRQNADLVFSINGEIVHMKASDYDKIF